IFEDSIVYDEVTRGYIRELGELNRLLAEEAGSVTEVVCGIPLTIK
ncbi:MAG TPA: adenosylcobinamide kinase, partial [Lachnospiraceae bacterium]|nr:adenosylcobinamide kinase [Lachnospiraceae bacterium]